MGPRQSCDAKRASRTARDASRHLVALVGLHRRRAVHEYALHAMLVVGSEAPCMTRARVYAALVGRVRVFRPPQRGRRKGTWRARARQDAFFKVPLERDQLTRRVALPPLGRLARGLGQSKIRHSVSTDTDTDTRPGYGHVEAAGFRSAPTPRMVGQFLSSRAEKAREHSGAEARRPNPGAHELERVLDWLPLHPAWTSCPDGRS